MKKTLILSACLLSFVLLSVFAYKFYDRSYQEHPLKKILRENGMVTKEEGNLKFTFSKTLSQSEQKDLIARCKEGIGKNLEFIGESPFDDSIHFILVPTRNDMKFFFLGNSPAGKTYLKDDESIPKDSRFDENTVFAVYGGEHNAIGHEIMHVVSALKWGINYCMWLDEGLATLSNPESFNCDGYTFEERYTYFLQNGMLIPLDSITNPVGERNRFIQNKIYYNHSAYIVRYLIDNYGMEKFKYLWQNGLDDFEELYGLSLEECTKKINDELNKKYPNPIDFNWEAFTEDCIE